MKFFVLALLVVCASQAAHASGVATGMLRLCPLLALLYSLLARMLLDSAFVFLASVFAACFACSCHAPSMFPPTVANVLFSLQTPLQLTTKAVHCCKTVSVPGV